MSGASHSSAEQRSVTPLGGQVIAVAKQNPDATQTEIADLADASRATVNNVLNDHYPQHNSVREGRSKKDRILDYAEENPEATREEIADAVGSYVRYVGHVMSETDHPAAVSDAERTRADIRELLEVRPPLSVPTIAERCDAAYDTVRRVMISGDDHR